MGLFLKLHMGIYLQLNSLLSDRGGRGGSRSMAIYAVRPHSTFDDLRFGASALRRRVNKRLIPTR